MKILIISHPPINTYEAMGKTFLSLFRNYDEKELAQLYIHPNEPDINVCESYFRITDKDILKSFFTLKLNGREVKKAEIEESKRLFNSKKDEQFYRNPKNRMSFRILMRDIMWKIAHWDNKNLNDWIRRENPTHIFVAPGNAKFLYDIAIKISKRYNLPIVTYVCDEYYFVKKQSKILDKIRVSLLQRKMRKLMSCCSHIITICDGLSKLYSNEFSVPATTIMTGASFNLENSFKSVNEPKAISYMGNIRYNRYRNLTKIGKILEVINSEDDTDIKLKIYTPEKNEEILFAFSNISAIELCDFVTGEEFKKVFHSSEILIHTEAFDEESVDLVKNSVSTKIADSLASGIPLFAYGPAEVASMKHLIDNNCAITATSEDELYDALKTAFLDSKRREEVVLNALVTAKKYHNSDVNSQKLYDIFKSLT